MQNLPTKLLTDLNFEKISNLEVFNNTKIKPMNNLNKKTHMSSISSMMKLSTAPTTPNDVLSIIPEIFHEIKFYDDITYFYSLDEIIGEG